MLISAVSVLVVAQSCSEIPEGLMNNPVYKPPVPTKHSSPFSEVINTTEVRKAD